MAASSFGALSTNTPAWATAGSSKRRTRSVDRIDPNQSGATLCNKLQRGLLDQPKRDVRAPRIASGADRQAALLKDVQHLPVVRQYTRTVVTALIKQAKKLPKELYKSLTWDRGKELTDHRRFTLATTIDVYFCDPQSPWQRGSNENTNGLLRQYFPKGTDLSVHSQAYLNKVARQLNERPRETLQFETPAERFNACVASTG